MDLFFDIAEAVIIVAAMVASYLQGLGVIHVWPGGIVPVMMVAAFGLLLLLYQVGGLIDRLPRRPVYNIERWKRLGVPSATASVWGIVHHHPLLTWLTAPVVVVWAIHIALAFVAGQQWVRRHAVTE